MIDILLAPNEVLSHSHDVESTSMTIEGEATLEYANTLIKMELNVAYTIPAHTTHTLTNIGNALVKISCTPGSH